MDDRSATINRPEARAPLGSVVALLSAMGVYLVLATLWHMMLPGHWPDDASYHYTHMLMPSLWWLVIVFICIGLGLGYLTRRKWPIAFGLVLPFPFVLWYEISRDPTSHNLFPFEIVFGWIPAFLIALGAAYIGRRIRVLKS